MPYLYPLLGITAWIAVVTLSTQAIISGENTKQLEKMSSYIQEGGQRLIANIPNQEVLYVTSSNTEQQSVAPTTNTPNEIITTPVAKPIQKVITEKRRQRDEEDEDD